MKLSESVTFDDDMDQVVIDGVRVTGDLLRTWTQPTDEGKWFRIVKKEDGVVTIFMKDERVLQ